MCKLIVTNASQLGKALKANADTIVIEGDFEKRIVRIKATGRVAWAIAIVGIAAAVAIILATGGPGIAFSPFLAGPAAVSTLGGPAALAAIGIAIAGGGVGALNKLRKYEVAERNNGRLVLKRN